MKKSLLALAVLTAVSGASHAQSSVTLYGKVDVGAILDSGSAKGKSLRINSGISGGSRLGFKGVEDLGGGMKAGFQLETGYCADSNAGAPNFCTGGNNFMGRQAHVDLSGAFGSLTMGRQYSLSFINLTTLDPFGTGFAGQTTNVFDSSGNGQGNPRVNNSFIYTTPNISGVTVAFLGGAGETQGDWRTGRTAGGAVTYAAGPLYIGAAINNMNGNAGALGRKNWNAGASYDFGVVKIQGIFQSTQTGVTPGVAIGSGANSWVDSHDWMGGVTVPIGAGALMASYIKHDDRSETLGVANHRDANQFGVGYIYSLSKRTSVYTAFGHINNENGANFTVGNATEAGTGTKAFNLGVVHNF